MATFIVSTINDKGDEIVVKRTDKFEEALDYRDQCNRGAERYKREQNPNANIPTYNLYEVA